MVGKVKELLRVASFRRAFARREEEGEDAEEGCGVEEGEGEALEREGAAGVSMVGVCSSVSW